MRPQQGAEHVEFVFEPSADDIECEAAIGDMVDGRRHLGDHQGVHQWNVTGGQDRDVPSRCAQRRGPSKAFVGRTVEIRRPAVTTPPAANAGFNFASTSTDVSPRGPSSVSTT